ncbi:MAG: Immunoglobulin protease precursor [Actinomycetota bacterium]
MNPKNSLKAVGALLLGLSVVMSGVTLQAFAAASQYTVSVSKTPTAGGNVASTDLNDDSWSIDATANANYHFTKWACTGSQTPTSATTASTTIALSANTTCTATFTLNSDFTVTAAKTPSAGGTVTAVDNGSNSWSITATAADTYHFTSWACSASQTPLSPLSASTKVTADADTTCTATFTEDSDYEVTVATPLATKGTVARVDNGSDSWSITATAKTGYHFTSWACTGSDTPTSVVSAATDVTATADITCTATFTANSLKTVTVASSSGIRGTVARVDNGSDSWSITATPKAGYKFTRWACTAAQNPKSATSATTTVTATSATTCTATFSADSTYVVTVAASGGGTVSKIENGSNVWEIFATADATKQFTRWSCSASQTPASIVSPATTVTATAGTTCTAYFNAVSANTVAVVASPTVGGSVSAIDDGVETWSISATANSGYRFSRWTCNSGETPDSLYASATTVTVTGASTCTATFTTVTVVLELSDSTDISGFAVGKSLLSAAFKTDIRDFVELTAGDKYVCRGIVTSETTLTPAKALAKKRAVAVCDYISSLQPSVTVRSEFSVPNRLVNTSVSRRVEIDAYTPTS